MIRIYQQGDEKGLDANEFSDWRKVEEVLTSEKWWKYTCVEQTVRAIVCFFEYEPAHYALFGLFGKDCTARNGKELRQLLENGINELSARRVRTWSKNCDMLNRWHEFLGFQIKEPSVINGEDFYLWELNRGS